MSLVMDLQWREVPAANDLPGYTSFDGPFQRPQQDGRGYRLIRLENGLKAVVIHNYLADKAAASLEVAVGHLDDPFDMPGLAHFCEHMLSKGSESFPAENDFLSFISSNGGSRNANTGPAYTNYWFSIAPGLLSSALSRFAAFFHEPLFTPSVTSREINAVDSENKKNLQTDSRRIFQLEKALTIPGHPWSKFGTGNLDSLTEAARILESEGRLPPANDIDGDGGMVGRETRRRLMEWWNHEYCAGRMTLAVLGRESLDDLTNLVVKLFSSILNRGLDPRPEIFDCPWGNSEMGTIVFVKTIKDYQSFSITFLLPYQQPQFRSKPARFLSHFLGHEGPGSIYSYLKGMGWIFSLSAGSQTWNRGIQTFQISGRLTEAGYAHHGDVLLAVFNYLSLLRSSNFPSYHYEEVRTLSEIHFRFEEKMQPHTYVKRLASELSKSYPPDCILCGGSVVWEWDERLVREILEGFILERSRVMLMSKGHNGMHPEPGWKTEKWYGTQYHVERLDPALVEKAAQSNPNADLFLPHPNPFVPTGLNVRKTNVSEPAKHPKLIRETKLSKLWHKADDQFWVPKAQGKLDIRSSLSHATPRQAVLTRLIVDLVQDALAEITYDAELAGLGYSVNTSEEGYLVSLSGYSNKLSVLLRIVLEKIKLLVVNPRRLAIMMEQLELEYKNFYLAQPSSLSAYELTHLLSPTIWTPAEKLSELQAITGHDIQQHKDELLSRIFIETLFNGNIRAQEAVDLMAMAEGLLTAPSSASPGRLFQRMLILPDGVNFTKQDTLTEAKELNSGLTYYCQFGDITDERLRATLDLIVHILREPCFCRLRTKEQLGYIVSSSRWSGFGCMGLCIEIQSTRDPVYLESRVEVFLDTFRKELESWSEEGLEIQKQGLIVKKLAHLKNLREESSRFWYHIRSGYYDFIRHETDAAIIRGLSMPELLKAYDLVSPGSRYRRKLSIHMRSQTLASSSLPDSVTLIENSPIFKAGLNASPAPIPVGSNYLIGPDVLLSRLRL